MWLCTYKWTIYNDRGSDIWYDTEIWKYLHRKWAYIDEDIAKKQIISWSKLYFKKQRKLIKEMEHNIYNLLW